MNTNVLSKDLLSIDQVQVGMEASMTRQVTDADIQVFADLSGDYNPVHLDDEYAAASPFKQRIAHGMLSATFLSTLLGTKLPGEGSIYTSQTLKFVRPVYVDDTVTAKVSVTKVNLEKKRVTLETVCMVDNKPVITGEAEIYIP